MSFLDITILYLAIGCSVGTLCLLKFYLAFQSKTLTFLLGVVAWPLILPYLALRSRGANQSLTDVFARDKRLDSAELQKSVLSVFPKTSGAVSFFEFRDDLERYAGLWDASNGTPNFSLPEIYSLNGQKPGSLQRHVVERNILSKLNSHLDASREELLSLAIRLLRERQSFEFEEALKQLFLKLGDKEALLKFEKRLAKDIRAKNTEVMTWLPQENAPM